MRMAGCCRLYGEVVFGLRGHSSASLKFEDLTYTLFDLYAHIFVALQSVKINTRQLNP